MISENITRKLDSLGRITLPKGLRARLGVVDGAELEIFTHRFEGKDYICLTTVGTEEDQIQDLMNAMELKGVSVRDVIQLLEKS